MSDQHPIPTSPGGRAPAGGADALERLDGVVAELRALAQVDWAAIATQHSTDLVRRLEQIQRTTTAIQADVLAAAESSGMWALDGQRNFDTWLSHTTGTSRGTAGKAARLSKSLTDDLPRTRKALAEGAISSDHARIISQRCAKTPKQRAKLSDPRQGEGYLVEQAKLMDATKFSRFAKTWAIESDPRAADRQWRKESAKEELSFTSSGDGYYISGFFNQVHGALIDEALRSHMGRKAADDLRSYNERRADGLVALAGQSLSFGAQLPTARIRPHLVVTVDYTTLAALVEASGPIMPGPNGGSVGGAALSEAEWAAQWRRGDDHVISASLDFTRLEGVAPATLPDGTPIPHGVLARLACESMLTRVVFGPESTVLNVGRDKRIFTKPQTRAIIARDRHCQYPGCDEGPSFGEIHHTISWARHMGNTDVDLGILLCFHHHDLVHEREISITRRSGEWIFTSRQGREIAPPDHAPPTSVVSTLACASTRQTMITVPIEDGRPPPARAKPVPAPRGVALRRRYRHHRVTPHQAPTSGTSPYVSRAPPLSSTMPRLSASTNLPGAAGGRRTSKR